MTKKEEQMKFDIWNNMKEYGFIIPEIALFTGFSIDEVQEFFDR